MEKLSAKKKLNVVRLYLSGLSHDEIAVKTGISKGAVGGIVVELKGGAFPEVADLADQVELLRDLSLDIKHSGLALGQCAVGAAVLKRIHECGLEPADIDRWLEIVQLAGGEDKAKAFVTTVYLIQDFMNKTGLTLEKIDTKIQDLETKAAELQPTLDEVNKKKHEIAGLEKKRDALVPAVDNLDKNYKVLNPIVKDLQTRQADLLKQIKQEESITASTQASLATWSQQNQKLAKAGFTIDTLVEFNDRIRVVAARHHLAVSGLRNRLLHDLETLGKGLELESKIKATRAELQTERKAVTLAKIEREELEAANNTLTGQKVGLEADIKAIKDNVIDEIGKIIPAAREMLDKFTGELRQGNSDVLETVQQLKDKSLDVGKELGRYEGIIEVNQWMIALHSLVTGEDSVEPMKVRVLLLPVLSGAQLWLKANSAKPGLPETLLNKVELLVKELEGWRVS